MSLKEKLPYSLWHDSLWEEQWEMEYHIPYIVHSLITVLESENNPYLFFESFRELWTKLDGLPQYGILSHNLDGAEYYHGHNRKIHSLDVAFLLEKIGYTNRLTVKEIVILIFVWLLHDIATPAWWDTTMKVLKDLKEEANFKKFLDYYPAFGDALLKTYWITVEELIPYINNEWLYGKLLDLADKIAYTLRDIERFVPTRSALHVKNQTLICGLEDIITAYPDLGEVINGIVIDNTLDDVYFSDPERLYALLLARSYMHNIIYLDAGVHWREHAVGLLIKFLLEQQYLTKEDLLLWKKDWTVLNDFFFIRFSEIDKIIPYNPLLFQEDFFEKQCFGSPEEREIYMQKFLCDHPEYVDLVFYIKTPKFKSWSQFLVKHDGEKKTLSEALAWSEKLEKLESMAKKTEKYLLLYPTEYFMKWKNSFPDFYDFLNRESKLSLWK